MICLHIMSMMTTYGSINIHKFPMHLINSRWIEGRGRSVACNSFEATILQLILRSGFSDITTDTMVIPGIEVHMVSDALALRNERWEP